MMFKRRSHFNKNIYMKIPWEKEKIMNFNETTHSMSGIYRILFENEKSYIGLTNDLRRRMIEHLGKDVREHPELPISKAIKKYSIKDIILLEEIDANDREKLKQQEKYWKNMM